MLAHDEDYNPFYCSIDAPTFLHNLRLGLTLHRHSQDHHLRHSFTSCLLRECGDLEFPAPRKGAHVVPAQDPPMSYLDAPKMLLIPMQADDSLMTHADRPWVPVTSASPTVSLFTSSSTDAGQRLPVHYKNLRGGPSWTKSSDDFNCQSFDLSGKPDKIKFSVPGLVYSPEDPALDTYNPRETRADSLVARVQELEGLCSDWLRFSLFNASSCS